jgi:beta-glucosidase
MIAVGIHHALSPVMDVARDPRWGRVGETYGEDPTLCAALSVAFTKGLQSDDLKKEWQLLRSTFWDMVYVKVV